MYKILFRCFLVFAFFSLILFCLFFGYKANKPMKITQVPTGMTYWQFMQDRFNAAKVVKPARCGYGMFGFYVLTVPFYSVLYTHVALHPKGFLAKVTARDANIPISVQKTPWYEVPDLWWGVVEHLSWSSLARPGPGCNLGILGQPQK
jgi:hypothetical protein